MPIKFVTRYDEYQDRLMIIYEDGVCLLEFSDESSIGKSEVDVLKVRHRANASSENASEELAALGASVQYCDVFLYQTTK